MSNFSLQRFFYNPRIAVAILKNIKTEQASTIVVISGEAIIAGSSFSFFASIGIVHPKSFAIITVKINVKATTKEIFKSLYCIKILTPLASAKVEPTIKAILNYFHITLKTSFVETSSIANPLIISVEA